MLTALALLLAPAFASAPSPLQAPQRPPPATDEEFDPRPFRIRDTQAARWRVDEIEGHIAARRWNEALDGLQELLDEHASDVLGAEQKKLANGVRAAHETHYGAAQKARELLFGLPLEARDRYRARHEPAARAAFLRAVQSLGRRALWEVARRFPLTESAQRAAWTLGDLEWERGNDGEAIAAWGHALGLALETPRLALAGAEAWNEAYGRLAARAGREPAELAAIQRRVALAAGALAVESAARDAARGARTTRLPGRDADTWFEPYVLPQHPFTLVARPSLHATRSESTLFVSTSLRVVALDAYTGALQWKSDEPPGWAELGAAQRRDFEKGIDLAHSWIQAAADERIVVAPLQIPVAFMRNQDFQRIANITTVIPDRRLFAFDVHTGAPLWNHMPPAGWDGDSGGFVERMSIAGAPRIVGRRVLVPCHRMQGRIDYHVGCFDLDTGALLWSTDVISGQRELNMFGRPMREFTAPPLVISGSNVIALTQLGAIACLDLYSGEVRWVTIYDQMPLPKNRDLVGRNERPVVWANQPPVVTGSTVIAAPFDSRDLVGLDLESGTLLWSLTNRRNGPIDALAGDGDAGLDQLVGAQGDTVYLAGQRVLAIRSPAGLDVAAPLTRRWDFVHPDLESSDATPFCALDEGRIVVPADSRCFTLDLASGRQVDEGLPWGEDRSDGNVLVCEREIFSVSNRKVCGYFDWGVLVDRARRAASEHPDDVRAALALGRLLANRGETERSVQGQSFLARTTLAEARQTLETALARGGSAYQAELAGELHRVLRSQARAFTDLADSREALAALVRAREFAPSPDDLRDTLLEELALVRRRPPGPEAEDRANAAAVDALYTLLDERCGTLTLLCDSAPQPTDADRAAELPFTFEPIVGGQSHSDVMPIELPVTLWTRFARERAAIRRQDTAREFALLHGLLADFGELPLLDATVGERATARIGALLRNGQRSGYEPFAAQAQTELDAALAARDAARLVTLAQHFPFSTAAQRANDARLEWSLDAGDVGEVARVLQTELPAPWDPAHASTRELGLVLRLAETARRAGSTELAESIVLALAADRPEHVCDTGPFAGRALRDVARELEAAHPAADDDARATFRADAKQIPDAGQPGEFELLGRIPRPEPGASADLLFGYTLSTRRASTLYAWNTAVPGARWAHPLPPSGGPLDSPGAGGQAGPWSRHVALTHGRVLVATADALVALNALDGEPAWSWPVPCATPRAMTLDAASGVAVLTIKSDEGVEFHGFDAWTGAPLWHEGPQPGAEFQPAPILSASRIVSLPMIGMNGVLVRDLFTGRRRLAFDLELKASQNIAEQAWIEGERLIVPRFDEPNLPELNQILCIDLATGARVWKIAINEIAGERRVLTDVLQHGERTYLLLKSPPGRREGNTQASSYPSGLFELSTNIGAVAPIHNLRLAPTDKILGSRAGRRTQLESSTVLVLSTSNAADMRIRALDLEGGELWVQSLGVKQNELQASVLAAPAWSDSAVALGYTIVQQGRQNSASSSTILAFFDRATGQPREKRALPANAVDKPDQLGLYPWGDVLVVRTKSRLEFLR